MMEDIEKEFIRLCIEDEKLNEKDLYKEHNKVFKKILKIELNLKNNLELAHQFVDDLIDNDIPIVSAYTCYFSCGISYRVGEATNILREIAKSKAAFRTRMDAEFFLKYTLKEDVSDINVRYQENNSKKHEMPELKEKLAVDEEKSSLSEIVVNFMDDHFPNSKRKVFHRIIQDEYHIDVNVLLPDENDEFYVLYTTGMSDYNMNIPSNPLLRKKKLEKAELMIFLPKDWKLNYKYNDFPEEAYWPIRLLLDMAIYPFENNSWIANGHTLQNGKDYKPYASDVDFCGVFVISLDDEISKIKLQNGKTINIYNLIPLYQSELIHAEKKGNYKLYDLLIKGPEDLCVNKNRKPVL